MLFRGTATIKLYIGYNCNPNVYIVISPLKKAIAYFRGRWLLDKNQTDLDMWGKMD